MTTDAACESCGMPLRTPDEHALGDVSRTFCKHCTRENGTVRSYDEILDRISTFLQHTQGLDSTVAREAAKGMMATLPEWNSR